MSKKLILIMGPPGSGKSTITKRIAKEHEGDITVIPVGDILREEIKKQSAIGKIAEKYVFIGDLVPGPVVMYEIFGKIKEALTDIVMIDGFPRGLNQMKELGDALFNSKDMELVSVIELKADNETCKNRALSQNSSEEEKKLFEHKMEVYNNLIDKIEEYYSKDNLLKIFDAKEDIETLGSKIDQHLKEKIALFK